MISDQEIARRVQHHPPLAPETVAALERLRLAVSDLMTEIKIVVPDGREKSFALTKAEEAMMWGNAGIARPPVVLPPV